MKYCPICERNYDDRVQFCEMDGATLRLVGQKQDPYVGKILKGRYNVISKIGQGGMGAVYLAEQMSVGRKVALKLLQGAYASDDEFIGRFRREARLAASLNHRNIVTVYDFDQSDDETLFIAMEYLQGLKLSDVVRRDGPLDVGRAVRLGLQIANGLNAAHRVGVIHRDIKPDNIMVLGDRASEEIKLMDFGIARIMDSGTISNLTRTGVIMGTPAYMAPEQAEGAAVSEQTDIYALGVVLYEMLAGSVPFKASTPSAVLIKQLQEMPVPLRKLRREVPAPIERVVMQALEKKPQKRQADMRQVVQGLQNLDGTLVVEETPQTMVQTVVLKPETRNSLQRLNKNYVWGGAAALLLLLIAVPVIFSRLSSSKENDIKKVVALTIQGKRELNIGERAALRVTGRYADGTETPITKNVEWSSSNDAVVRVGSSGDLEGRNNGFADVSARLQGVPSAVLTVVVSSPPPSVEEPKPPVTESQSQIATRVQEVIKVAGSFRDQGDYSKALDELKKAKALAPNDRAVQTEIQHTKNACFAERRQGTTTATCE